MNVIDNFDVPILLGIDDICQKDRLCGNRRQFIVLLGNICLLLITSGHSLSLYFYILILLDKLVGLQHHMLFFVRQVTLMQENERIYDVKMFRFALGF